MRGRTKERQVPQRAQNPWPLKDPSHQTDCLFYLWNYSPALEGKESVCTRR